MNSTIDMTLSGASLPEIDTAAQYTNTNRASYGLFQHECRSSGAYIHDYGLSLPSDQSNPDSTLWALEGHRARNMAVIGALATVWKKHLMNVQAATDVDAISETIDAAYEAIDQFGVGALDFSGFDPDEVNGEHLAALLRATYSVRAWTLGWNDALQVAEQALKAAHVDVDDALAGLSANY